MRKAEIPLDWVPTLLRRYVTTAIDGLLVVTVWVLPTAAWPSEDTAARYLRALLATAALFAYEPVCTGRFVTLGQWVTRVRVLRFDNGRRIGVARAYGRIIVKVCLGVISFFVLPFTVGRRAIHDLATGSIVIMAEAEPDFRTWIASRAETAGPDDTTDHAAV